MAKSSLPLLLSPLAVDFDSSLPLHRQLYDRLREAILAGQLVAGMRLPSTRTLASDLGVSRNTVLQAFDQLIAEGYVEGKHGAGTYVARVLPDELLAPRPILERRIQAAPSPRRLSSQVDALLNAPGIPNPIFTSNGPCRAFRVGLPAFDAFPLDIWTRLLVHQARALGPENLNYQHPAGYGPLREAIAHYIADARGVRCTPEQVIIVNGSQQALDLAARVLLNPGDHVWIEDPCYLGARNALLGAGARLVPVPVDGEGLDVVAGIERCADARLAFVTPSHQFPLGMTMSLPRRLALLEWAADAGAWVLEDDYDSEFRYDGRPLAALQGLDQAGRVIYLGTFSKVLFPGLRLGYLVVSPDLINAFLTMRCYTGFHAPVLEQAVLADFISEGHFARHIRRMRRLYAERQAALLTVAQEELYGLLDVRSCATGMHVLGWLPTEIDDQQAAHVAARHNVDVWPLSLHCFEGHQPSALLLGYASVREAELPGSINRLATALRALL